MIYVFADCELDTDQMVLRRLGDVVPVQPQVFELLRYLVANPDRVMSRDEIIQEIWHGRIVSDAALSSRIKSARKAIGDSGNAQALIKTVHRRGFRLTAAVTSRSVTDRFSRYSTPEAGMPAIAVLPFHNMSDLEQEYFSDGLTEDLITALTLWKSFPVIARNSSFAYKNKSIDVKQIGRELGSRYLLDGSVRKAGGGVRVSAQLIDGTNGHQIWAQRYDRDLADIFKVQDEIAQSIVATVAPKLAKAEVKRSITKGLEDLGAWDLCLRGMAHIHEMTPEANAKARDLFRQAIAIHHDYCDGHAGVAMSHNRDILLQDLEDRPGIATQALDAAQMAVKLDAASAVAHRELSTAYQLLDRRDDALAEVRVAIELNPNDVFALHSLGNMLDLNGDPDGIPLMEKAQKLNPEDAHAYTHPTYLARAYFNADAFDEAADRARQAVRRNPSYAPAHYLLAVALGQLDRADEAWLILSKCEALRPGFIESRTRWQPYANPASNEKLREALARILRSKRGASRSQVGR